jgi:hypothetical protein
MVSEAGGLYHLVAFDATGSERTEQAGPYSRELIARVARDARLTSSS